MREVRRFYRRIRNVFNNFLVGDRDWANFRLIILILAILAFFYAVSFSLDREVVAETAGRLNGQPGIGILPHRILLLLAPFYDLRTARYLLAPVGGSMFAIMIAALYVQDIYELGKYKNALRYVMASIFGLSYPGLEIRDGIKQIGPGEENLLDKIGGPGWVVIRPGNAVLFERLTNPTAVLAEGPHFVPRFEMIKEIVDLKDQHGYQEKLSAVTKDGVVVSVRDIHYIYRVAAGQRLGGDAGRTQEHPYPYSVKAVRNVAYGRSVDANGMTDWPRIVRIIVEGEIQSYIRRRQLDQVTSPQTAGTDPRGEIHQLYNDAFLRARLRNVGAELLWFGIGHIDVDDPIVNNQRVQTWQAGWRGDAAVITAYGEALRKVYMEQGRAEAQAEILLAIIQALRDAGIQPGQPDMGNVFLLRVAQLLEAMNEPHLET
jgi:hypothetical protein